MKIAFRGAAILGVLVLWASSAHATSTQGTMYYTTFSGGVNVHSVDYNYVNATSFTLSNNTGLASTPGADGIVFTSDQFLAVGGQGAAVYRVNPTTGAFTSQSTTGPSAFHMSVAPNGSIIAASIPGAPVLFNSTLTNTGVPLTFGGGVDSLLDTIVFDKNGQGWYTSSGAGGVGNFGKVNINFITNTYTTVQTMTGVAAAHGAAYDAFTDTIVLFGDGHISQVDPNAGGTSLLHDLGGQGGTFDQGAVDGKGHIFAANNDGNLTFLDIGISGNVAAADFMSTQFLAGSLDDVAPLSGLGSNTVPEPGALTLMSLGLAGLLGYGWRHRRNVTA